ncbi:MAG: dihydroneopterin aldolase [Spirulinaceae cyanobacterium]
MDRIKVSQIRCYGYTGYLQEEKVLGQWFEVDLTLWLDLTTSGSSDDLTQTLDYRQAISTVKQIVQTAKFDLIEKLATEIAKAILAIDPIQQVRVELTKLAAPIPDFNGEITIDITRSRE